MMERKYWILFSLWTHFLFAQHGMSSEGKSSMDSVKVWCPSDVRAFACFPSIDCPSPSHYYRCVDQLAFVDVCNQSVYDPTLNGCSHVGHQLRRKRSLEKSSVSSEAYLDQDALGREVHLGNIFYGTLDRISTDENMWSEKSLENRNIQKFETQNQIVKLSNYQLERLNNLDIDASLALSFMGGLVKVEGSANYIDKREKKENTVSASIVYSATNTRESTTQDMRINADFANTICKDIGKENGPTHVVSSITRGFRGILTFSKTTSDSAKNSEVGGALKVFIKSLPGIQIEGEASVNFTENEKILTENLEVEFNGDTILQDAVTTYEDALKAYRKFSLVASTSTTVTKYRLSKIENYCRLGTKAILRSISDDLTKKTLEALKQLEKEEREVETLKNSKAARAFSTTLGANLILFGTKLSSYISNFKQQLGEILPQVRGEVEGEKKLVQLLQNLEESAFNYDKAGVFLGLRKREYKTIEIFMENKGAPGTGIVVEEDKGYEANKCRVDFLFHVEFVLPFLPEDDVITSYLEVQSVDESDKWYFDGIKLKKAGDLYRKFLDFYKLNNNRDTENVFVCFIIKLERIRSVQQPKIKIVGPEAKIFAEYFNVPEKIYPDGDIQVTHDTIQYNVKTSNDVMTHLEVEYVGIFANKEVPFPTKKKKFELHPSGTTQITLGKLYPGVNYEIKQRLISVFNNKQWAVGPISDTMTITTSSSSPPSGVFDKEKDEKKINFSWKPAAVKVPQQSLEYQVFLYNNNCISGEPIQSNSVTNTEFTVKNLLPAHVYCLSVESIPVSNPPPSCSIKMEDKTEVDMSCKYRNSVQLTASTNPSPPTRIQVLKATTDSVSLKWDKPIISPTASLLRYSVEITRVDFSSKQALSTGSQSVESETEFVTVGALASGATYSFQVKVFTTEGDSSLSNPVTATTTFQETELEQFRKSLNFNKIELDLSSVNGKLSAAERNIVSSKNRLSAAERSIVSSNNRLSAAERSIVSSNNRLSAAEKTGSWCAYKYSWTKRNTRIIFDKLIHNESNVNRYSLNYRTGKFTAPRAGVFFITFSYQATNDPDEWTYVYIFKDGVQLVDTQLGTHYTGGGSGQVRSTGSRAVYQRLETGNTIHLGATSVKGEMHYILLCVEFVNN